MSAGLLNISVTGLNAAMGGIRTVQQNIANANTAGYHRQQVVLEANQGAFSEQGFLGNGVRMETVRRVYDQFLNSQTQNYQSKLSASESYTAYASQVDMLLGDDATGLGMPMSNFFASVNEVANDPTALTAREQVLTTGKSLAARFNQLANRLLDIKDAIKTEISNSVSPINDHLDQIRLLNSQIRFAQGNGHTANDLLDQREQHVAELNQLVNVSQVQQSDGTVAIMLGNGQFLVLDSLVRHVTAVAEPTDSSMMTLAIEGPDNGTLQEVDEDSINGGSLGGLLAMRKDVLNPSIRDLDLMAQGLADAFNQQQLLGNDLNGNPGGDFFSYISSEPPVNVARTLSVAFKQADLIAAAGQAEGSGPGDNSNAIALANLRKAALVGNVTLSEFNVAMIGRNAANTHAAEADVKSYTVLHNQSRDALQAVGGVNLDEEAINLIQFQQAYQAAAKAIQTSSSLFDTILGVVQ